jgi:hypothetical protein
MAFEYKDLDRLPRAMLPMEQKQAVDYWRSLHRLKGVLIAYGKNTAEVLEHYRREGGQGTLAKGLAKVQYSGELTTRKLQTALNKVDAYLRDIDARLADGTKWYTAAEISDMQNV